MALGWACFECAATGRTEHAPTSECYPDDVVRRDSFTAGGGHGWTISTLVTPRLKPARWKIVVITGAPSWAEYWAPALAILPKDREMVVVDRPGFANSEPAEPVTDIRIQAQALAPLLRARPGQKVMLVGQSYGAAIAAVMAQMNPGKVRSLVLLSGYFGELGPTSRWLVDMGLKALRVIPRDLRNAVIEVSGQPQQLDVARRAIAALRIPVHVVHGDKDDFAPLETAEKLAAELRPRRPTRLQRVPGANHFLNDGPAEEVIAALEACIPARRPLVIRLPALPRFNWSWRRPPSAEVSVNPVGA
jgi:pimeloyl-ACP methyl ester carboxylesterase